MKRYLKLIMIEAIKEYFEGQCIQRSKTRIEQHEHRIVELIDDLQRYIQCLKTNKPYKRKVEDCGTKKSY